jgi:hypothetical protein
MLLDVVPDQVILFLGPLALLHHSSSSLVGTELFLQPGRFSVVCERGTRMEMRGHPGSNLY